MLRLVYKGEEGANELRPVRPGDSVVVQDHHMMVRYIQFPKKAGSTGYVYLSPIENLDIKVPYTPSIIGAVWLGFEELLKKVS